MFDTRFNSLLAEFRRALVDCQRLYVSAGEACVRDHPHLIGQSGQKYVQMMDDLHRALLVKIFVTIAEADRRWSQNEQLLAQILFDHIWKQSLSGEELRTAMREVSRRSLALKWYALIRPFDQIAPLRDRVAELETVVLRVANIIAKADGKPSATVLGHLQSVEQELQRHLRPIPIDEPSQHAEADSLGGQAIQTVERTASDVRSECRIETSETSNGEHAKSREEQLAEALAELDALIGLASVRKEVRTLINFLKIQQERERAGLPQTTLSLHMVFGGNPGTGKTTVARIVGKIYGAMGILAKGHLVETDRSGLVAEYAGQTGPKANKKIDEALDGVLFIDEAYSLVAEEGDDPFGREAVQTLLKRMEDNRDRLVVILAGYPQEMQKLLASNPGLSSRFSRHLTFADYSPGELGHILGKMCAANRYELPKLTRVKVLLGLDWLYKHRDRHFGNGRTVRNLFEHAIRRLADRIATVTKLSRQHLTVLQPEDIEFVELAGRLTHTKRLDGGVAGQHASPLPSDLFDDLKDEQRRFRTTCCGCASQTLLPQAYLTRRVRCKKCGEKFTVEWGEPA